MSTQQKEGLPEELRVVAERLDEWRRKRVRRGAMPEELWEAAAKAARTCGVHRVSKVLHMNYGELKSRMLRLGTVCEQACGDGFVEFRAVTSSTHLGNTELELLDGAGRILRLRLEGIEAGDILGLAERLWRGVP